MDLLQRLRIFVAVAERAGFARAAETLSLARPRVTNAVAALELEMGVRLFHRTTRRTTLTGEGEALYDQALQLLSEADRTVNLFGGSATSPRGRLRVDVPVALARSVIVPKLAAFRSAYPDIEIVLGVSDQPTDLIADGIDCVIRIGDLPMGSMVSRLIGRIDLVVCGSPDYLAARETARTIADIADHEAVVYFSGRGRRPVEWQFIEDGIDRSLRVRAVLLVNDSEAFVACAIAGLGLIQVPRITVADHLASGALVELLGDLPTISRPVSVLYPSRQHLTPQVRAFIEWSASLLV
ncbi:LysR family transcriptional regulator [Sphingomonas sp. BIUV-7]|uniref:LysR family transcriptional regulator n=1 Tax=Sphingomonas natans TaxID=3063330 RepID=A0ABT8YD92_9SPHN|nr:LysR family transcriptional regulator [Sphingomonas sp. BIUV-7]MDO6416312.1 LysR family transcriptional regulator [Sphingomonas sp. BIUV-7]